MALFFMKGAFCFRGLLIGLQVFGFNADLTGW